ncbi:MAG: ribonuclease HII [Actinomycetaceae bacterium]|nr:ribonuclease HII [Arcanobacterium sp.]MDD7504491.1 ribonuclease HII [Actinomycetaceae bacterium]MDY6142839.1 ribonuclease HII [Arcanobacterium sp.]
MAKRVSVAQYRPTREIEKRILDQLISSGSASCDTGDPQSIDDGHTVPREEVFLAGVDEVGRGALAGPASVGIALINVHTSDDFPRGLQDSKLMSARRREEIIQPVQAWVAASAVGHAPAYEVNEYGILGALRNAARRACKSLEQQGYVISGLILDGKHNWWSQTSVMETGEEPLPDVPVFMEIKGDARCAVVAAASVLAKVERDALMVELDAADPRYHWAANKGYSSAAHIAALNQYGPSPHHRTSWKLPGVA